MKPSARGGAAMNTLPITKCTDHGGRHLAVLVEWLAAQGNDTSPRCTWSSLGDGQGVMGASLPGVFFAFCSHLTQLALLLTSLPVAAVC